MACRGAPPRYVSNRILKFQQIKLNYETIREPDQGRDARIYVCIWAVVLWTVELRLPSVRDIHSIPSACGSKIMSYIILWAIPGRLNQPHL